MPALSFKRKILLFALLLSILPLACQPDTGESGAAESGGAPGDQAAQVVEVGSLDDLMALFDQLNYNHESWLAGNREVPRLSFDDVDERWKKASNEIPVSLKKQVFFRLMSPLVLVSNEKILIEREMIVNGNTEDPKIIELAKKYKVIKKEDSSLGKEKRLELLVRVDTLPPSLVLAQAAEESGWGSSRFTIEGNSFFGQWDFSGNGMVPKEQRKELGNYGLARFASPLASVEGYMLNINTHNAYRKLRELRASLRADKNEITGLELAGTLAKYSERGQAYIDGLREMIRFNKLEPVDEAYLSDGPPIRLVVKRDE